MAQQPPKELLEQRPILEGDPDIRHPSMGNIGSGNPPTKYTKAVHDTIVAELRKGQRPQGACARAGISVTTFQNWVKWGKEGNPWLEQFAEDVEIAFNAHEADLVDVVHNITTKSESDDTKLKAATWKLERARADGYSKQVKTLVDKQIEAFMVRLEAALDPATFEKVLSVYLGQAVATPEQLTVVEVKQLEDGSSEE